MSRIVLVTGSRSIQSMRVIEEYLTAFLRSDDIVLQGGASGVDLLTQTYCRQRNIDCRTLKPIHLYSQFKFPYRPTYYLVRDLQMAELANCGLAIWDGQSTGTKATIQYLQALHKPVEIHIVRIFK